MFEILLKIILTKRIRVSCFGGFCLFVCLFVIIYFGFQIVF